MAASNLPSCLPRELDGVRSKERYTFRGVPIQKGEWVRLPLSPGLTQGLLFTSGTREETGDGFH